MWAGVSSACSRRWARIERARPVEPVGVADRLGDLDLAVGAHDLGDERHREQRAPGRPGRSAGPVPGWRTGAGRHRQVGRDVVPGARDLLLVEDELGASRAHDRHGSSSSTEPAVARGRASLRRGRRATASVGQRIAGTLPMIRAAAARNEVDDAERQHRADALGADVVDLGLLPGTEGARVVGEAVRWGPGRSMLAECRADAKVAPRAGACRRAATRGLSRSIDSGPARPPRSGRSGPARRR